MPLTHYIIVRRDLPIGVLLAMVTHAAGESFYKLASAATLEQLDVEGFKPAETIAVVLGARNAGKLAKLVEKLTATGAPFVEIHETEGEFAGQLMAVGVVPGRKTALSSLMNGFQMLREVAL